MWDRKRSRAAHSQTTIKLGRVRKRQTSMDSGSLCAWNDTRAPNACIAFRCVHSDEMEMGGHTQHVPHVSKSTVQIRIQRLHWLSVEIKMTETIEDIQSFSTSFLHSIYLNINTHQLLLLLVQDSVSSVEISFRLFLLSQYFKTC